RAPLPYTTLFRSREGQQRGGELVGDVDPDRGRAGDGDVGDREVLLPALGAVAQIGDEVLGGLLGGTALGDHDHHGHVGALVGGRQLDLLDVVELGDVALELLDDAERIGGVDDVGGDQQRAVVAGAELLGDEVVGVARISADRLGAQVRQGQLEVLDRDRERADADHDRQDRQRGHLGHQAHPGAAEGAAGALRGVRLGQGAVVLGHQAPDPAGPQPLAEDAHQRRQHGQRHHDGQRHGRGRGDAHHGEEGDAGDEQAHQRDDHGEAGEDDGAAGGGQGLADRLVHVVALGELVAVAGEDEQGVVDADGEAEHGAQRGGDRGDVHPGGQRDQRQHRHADADDRGDDRDEGGDQGAEDDREDDQGGDDAEDLAGAEGDLRALQHLPAEVRLQARRARFLHERADLLDGALGEGAGLPLHLELGDDRGVVVGARAGGEVVEGGGGGRDALDLGDVLHERVDQIG